MREQPGTGARAGNVQHIILSPPRGIPPPLSFSHHSLCAIPSAPYELIPSSTFYYIYSYGIRTSLPTYIPIHVYTYIDTALLLLSRVHMAFVYRLNARRRRTSRGTRRQVCILKLLPGALLSRRRRRRRLHLTRHPFAALATLLAVPTPST